MKRRHNPMRLGVLLVFMLVSGCLGRLSGEHKICDGLTIKKKPVQEFSITYDAKLRLIHLRGMLQIGLVPTFKQALLKYPQTNGVVLDSAGGNIYQARGLAKVISTNQLDTYSYRRCFSACTIAYIAGENRYLSANAQLGFHTYNLDSPLVFRSNITREQQKDLALFKQKIADEMFTDKIFATKCPDLWIPTQQALLDAGVVHKITPASN